MRNPMHRNVLVVICVITVVIAVSAGVLIYDQNQNKQHRIPV